MSSFAVGVPDRQFEPEVHAASVTVAVSAGLPLAWYTKLSDVVPEFGT
ncbi:hypothetical protein LMG28138_06017 [Pararobbsia alpina]|uniref:Uncharacterized protein n=1 Tax=Pararobbsia alpina TaxID=621374 RepID=A0A6S7BPV6_9BURK|nr:hypothetical protein LMG28138_06017 [Pararobbsia alpina]